MKMKKATRFLSMALVTIVFAVFAIGASACTPKQEANAIASAADTQITLTVKAAQTVGSALLAAGFSSDSPVIQALCAGVEQQTARIEQQAETQLNGLGVAYESESYTVSIGGNQVLIDPLKII